MREHVLSCKKCHTNLLKSCGEQAKLRTKLIKWDRNGMYAVCKSCGSEVPITADLLKSIESSFVYEIQKS